MPPQPNPAFAQAVEHQRRWGSPDAATQLGDIAAKTGQVAVSPINAVKGLYDKVEAADAAARNPSPSSDAYVDPNAMAKDPDVPATALNLMGTGVPFARPGSLGSAGGSIKAYHGSPHDFDKFDISKIGTGEGAQAYGHGLYFAENEGTARSYREALTRDKDRVLENGGKLPQWVASKLESRNPVAVDDLRKDFQGRITEAEQEAKTSSQPWLYPGKIQGLNDVLKAIEDHASGVPIKPPGRMYEVAIKAHPEEFLDWDKPLSDQPHIAQKAPQLLEAARTEAYNRALAATQQARRDELFAMVKDPMKAPAGFAVEAMAPRSRGGVRSQETSEQLRAAGIPGIRYLDQGSRVSGEGSRNYVVFHHDLVDVLKKYGIAGIGALPALGAYHFQDSDRAMNALSNAPTKPQ